MRSRSTSLLLFLIVLCAFHGCSQRPTDPFAKARSTITEFMQSKQIASFQVAVAKDGRVIFEEAYGWANVKEKIPSTKETMYLVASIDKPFVSTAIMLLAERGKIRLQGPINDYIAKKKLIAYRGIASDATVARLLLHVSGLPSGYYVCGDSVPQEKRWSNSNLLDLSGVLVYPPGTVYEYSNFGYGLIDDIVRNAANVDLRDFITKEIVTPLGLSHTKYFTAQPLKELIATQNVAGGTLPFFLNSDGYTGMYSTAGDLVRFGMFHLKNRLDDQPRILADSSIDLLRTYREPGVKHTSRTLAWDVQKDYGYEIAMHGGGGPGIHNYLYMIPSENLVIAYMSNAQYPSSDEVLVELIAAAIPDFNFLARIKGRGWPASPQLDERAWEGNWTGKICGPKGACPVAVSFVRGIPKLRIIVEGKAGTWLLPNRPVQKSGGKVCYRFDARIPYLEPFASHDEVILVFKPQGDMLIGSASAAREKNFGAYENYVLPQYLELKKVNPQ